MEEVTWKKINYRTTARCDCRIHGEASGKASGSNRCGSRVVFVASHPGYNSYCEPCYEKRVLETRERCWQ